MSKTRESEEQFLSLDTLKEGACIELFNHELQRVLENILDANTDPKQKRSVTLEVTIKPSESRELGDVQIHCRSKLAAVKGVQTVAYFGREHGRAVALERNPRQLELPTNVTKIN